MTSPCDKSCSTNRGYPSRHRNLPHDACVAQVGVRLRIRARSVMDTPQRSRSPTGRMDAGRITGIFCTQLVPGGPVPESLSFIATMMSWSGEHGQIGRRRSTSFRLIRSREPEYQTREFEETSRHSFRSSRSQFHRSLERLDQGERVSTSNVGNSVTPHGEGEGRTYPSNPQQRCNAAKLLLQLCLSRYPSLSQHLGGNSYLSPSAVGEALPL